MSRSPSPVPPRPAQTPAAYGYRPGVAGVPLVRRSAAVVIPALFAHLPGRHRVLDLGCGTGDWLAECRAQGAREVLGYDGPWVPASARVLPAEVFTVVDFYEALPPLPTVDLALCLEVLEHVADPVALRLLDALCAAAPVVLFSAALPGQGGHGHINEQWASTWIARFAERGLIASDVLRSLVWQHPEVAWWYQQNLLLFARPEVYAAHGRTPVPVLTDVVHPFLYRDHGAPKRYFWWKLRQFWPWRAATGKREAKG